MSQLLGGAIRLIRVRRVTDVTQFVQHLAQRQLAVGPAHMQTVIRQVEPCFADGGQTAQVFFNQPATRRAADAFDQQRGLGLFALMADKGFLHFGAIVQRQLFGQLHGKRFRVG